MSTMLEQALVDAAALKEAALKNAETAILERYAADVKNTMDSLLEVDEFGMPEEEPEDVLDSQIPPAAADGESACPCPDKEETVTLTFDAEELKATLDALDADELGEPMPQEELPAEITGEPIEDEEIDLALQEELELDEELLFEYPEEDSAPKPPPADWPSEYVYPEECRDVKDPYAYLECLRQHAPGAIGMEETLGMTEDLDLEKLVEEVIVDLAGDELTGWAGRPGSDIEYAKEIRLARLASTEAKEQTEKLKAALGELTESSNVVANENKILKQTLETMKEKLEEVNLSNAKLLYMNRTLNSPSLNERQKNKIVESIQIADSVEEAKVIFETLQSTVGEPASRKPKSLSEAISKPSLSMPKRKSPKSSKDTIVKERFQRLAGISKTD